MIEILNKYEDDGLYVYFKMDNTYYCEYFENEDDSFADSEIIKYLMKNKDKFTSLPDIQNCSNTMKSLFKGINESDNNMLFFDTLEDLEEIGLDKRENMVALKEEIDMLKLNKYFTFGEDSIMTVFGGLQCTFKEGATTND